MEEKKEFGSSGCRARRGRGRTRVESCKEREPPHVRWNRDRRPSGLQGCLRASPVPHSRRGRVSRGVPERWQAAGPPRKPHLEAPLWGVSTPPPTEHLPRWEGKGRWEKLAPARRGGEERGRGNHPGGRQEEEKRPHQRSPPRGAPKPTPVAAERRPVGPTPSTGENNKGKGRKGPPRQIRPALDPRRAAAMRE